MSLWLFQNRFISDPHEAVELDVSDPQTWERLLNEPEVVGDEDHGHFGTKNAASVVCGARYFSESHSRAKENVDCVECLVLDVDCAQTAAGRVPDEGELRAALLGVRAVVYTSPSHTAKMPRWRVLIPLATPLPPKKHRALVATLSEGLVPGYAGCIDVDSTGDPCRLGFIGVTKNPSDYTWWAQ